MINARKHAKSKANAIDFALPDSRASIQLALYQVMNAIGSAQIDPKTAGLLLRSLQIASRNVPDSSEMIPSKPVMCVFQTPDGDEAATECGSFEMPQSCSSCKTPTPNCPLRDETELRILAIARGIDSDQKEDPKLTLPQSFAAEFERYLHGGATPQAREKINALIERKKAMANT